MPAFVRTKNGFLNVDQIIEITAREQDPYAVTSNGQMVSLSPGWGEVILQIIPVQGEWQALNAWVTDSGILDVEPTPVVAWALGIEGFLFPITGFDRSGVVGEQAWQKVGHQPVYTPHTTYENVEDWAKTGLGLEF